MIGAAGCRMIGAAADDDRRSSSSRRRPQHDRRPPSAEGNVNDSDFYTQHTYVHAE